MKKNRRLSNSERMRRVRSKGTSLEKRFAKLLRINGIGYQSHPKIYGRPDFRIRATKILIFCDSSFWHGRNKSEITGRAFKTNRNFWVKKLRYNKERDARIGRILRKKGWVVLRFWDDEIMKRPWFVVSKLNRYVKANKKR
ncbi:MAG: mismatch endonuclease Vsr protein [Candidatus Yanofskybacteria bacterium GW2011_GWC2_41_9]|uniref:Mismatch endonuclease Vsr protein n=1 Tax=Candidatus Yanofskybacteria bacterium GW2011_GWC2_41_9 TaxID=1619029 RepID=A0A0G1AHX1_9BACT|nr:MAG: mismatch endonuclease Vsr protein [Candidatus Yanofskybacteria bacterium GW2011_GWC2_41_9]